MGTAGGPVSVAGAAPLYLVLLRYVAPLEAVDRWLPAHRDYLQQRYAEGSFLLSGRREPRTGGVVLATAPSRAALDALLDEDPFHREGVAEYEVVAFVPTMAAAGLAGLLAG